MPKSGVNLRVTGLSKQWGLLTVLDGLEFDITPGTFLTLLGPSGCGKSTALRLMAGLDEVTAGQIFIDGKDVTTLPPAQRNIGMVFQNYALFPHMSVRQNILYGLRVRRTPVEEQIANLSRVTELMGLDQLLDRKPSQLSGGQQQRVALARVLVANRPLVLMDEPLSNLDAKLRAEIRGEIRDLNKTLGITVVYVTHDQSEALSMSDKVLLMNRGSAEQFGTPSEIYAQPQSTFAAGFIGTPPMNLVSASTLDSAVLGSSADQAPDLLVGLRSEDMRLHKRPTPLGLKGRIVSAEYEGVHSLVVIEIDKSNRVVVAIPKTSSFELGSDVFVDADRDAVHLFRRSDGQKVTIRPGT